MSVASTRVLRRRCAARSEKRIGEDTLYGRFPATRSRRSGGREAKSNSRKSDWTSVTLDGTFGCSSATISGSSSMAVRLATRGARRSVNAPGPGPISRNVSSGPGSIAATSLSAHAGCRKCWPYRFFARMLMTVAEGVTPRRATRRASTSPRSPRFPLRSSRSSARIRGSRSRRRSPGSPRRLHTTPRSAAGRSKSDRAARCRTPHPRSGRGVP